MMSLIKSAVKQQPVVAFCLCSALVVEIALCMTPKMAQARGATAATTGPTHYDHAVPYEGPWTMNSSSGGNCYWSKENDKCPSDYGTNAGCTLTPNMHHSSGSSYVSGGSCGSGPTNFGSPVNGPHATPS
jgi:hypothetical protein